MRLEQNEDSDELALSSQIPADALALDFDFDISDEYGATSHKAKVQNAQDAQSDGVDSDEKIGFAFLALAFAVICGQGIYKLITSLIAMRYEHKIQVAELAAQTMQAQSPEHHSTINARIRAQSAERIASMRLARR